MTVHAECGDCNDVHPLPDRSMGAVTTTCPACGSTSYATETDVVFEKSARDRIKDAVKDVDGVGAQSLENILDRFDFYAEFESADVGDLTEIEHVGRKTAERIRATVE